MSEFGRFFLPGPTEVLPEVLQALARPVIGHRGDEIVALLRAVDAPLRAVFRTRRPVYVATASATLFMEAAVRGGVSRRALCLVNGAFSGRFRDLVVDCGRDHVAYEVGWGEAHEPERVESMLRQGGFDALTVVHSETSTGVLNPLQAIAEAARAAEAVTGDEVMVLVDGVTSVGGALVEADAWGLDLLLTGSQKALALPPGLAFATASERLLRRAATLAGRGHYADLLEYDRYAARHQTPTTPAVNLLFALAEQMRRIAAEGIEARARRHEAMARRCHEWADTVGARYGASVLAPPQRRSPTVTALRTAATAPPAAIVAGLKRHGFTIGGGYGRLADTTIRIGHMGDHDLPGLDALLAAVEAVLGSFGRSGPSG